jgi:hypothetical protein
MGPDTTAAPLFPATAIHFASVALTYTSFLAREEVVQSHRADGSSVSSHRLQQAQWCVPTCKEIFFNDMQF